MIPQDLKEKIIDWWDWLEKDGNQEYDVLIEQGIETALRDCGYTIIKDRRQREPEVIDPERR